MQQFQVKVRKAWAGMAIDLVLVEAGLGLSRRKIRRILDMGGIQVGQRRVQVASHKVYEGELITLRYSLESLSGWSRKQFVLTREDILYASNDLVAINKPPLLPSQAPRSKELMHAAQALSQYYQAALQQRQAFYLCHRLDKETSGVLVLAQNEVAAARVMEQFKQRKLAKTYLALCHGLSPAKTWQVEGHLSAIDKKTGLVKVVRSGGKFARTRFQVLEALPGLKLSLLACYPETGRSHQIRVHLAHAHLPIVGDKKYAGQAAAEGLPHALRELSLTHHFLHAAALRLSVDPRQAGQRTLIAALPPRFIDFLKQARFKMAKPLSQPSPTWSFLDGPR